MMYCEARSIGFGARGSNGFSLIELMIVVCIIGLMGILGGIQYAKWIRTYNAEKEMRELHADLLYARSNAMMKTRFYFVTLAAGTYTIYEDTNPAPDGDGTLQASDSVKISKALKPYYGITWNGAAEIDFNTKGLVVSGDEVICSNADVLADNNCVVLSATRTSLGRLSTTIPGGGACNATNCVVR